MSFKHLIAAGAAMAALAVIPATAQDFHANPTYTTLTLTTGFAHDPTTVHLSSGGGIDAAALNNGAHVGNCSGMVANAPDVRLNFTAGSALPLIISARSPGANDTTLVINGPDGQWYCNDDRANGDLNPAIRFEHPTSGQYDIWVGTFGGSQLLPTDLSVSELTAP